MFFFVKVRIDLDKMPEMGKKLVSGELDKSHLQSTWCLQDDPSVGLNIWEADDREHFDAIFAPHRAYYAEVLEIVPVITAPKAQQVLMERIKG